MAITAAQVKELREMTGCGMMDCKKALNEADGNLDKAVEILRTKGMAKATKKAGRVAAEGVIIVKSTTDGKKAVMLEINSETDFVARDENFTQFANDVTDHALANSIPDLETLMASELGGEVITTKLQGLIAKIGENVQIRRIALVESTGTVANYVHGQKIGVLVAVSGGDTELAKDVAMHIAATNPMVIAPDQIDEDIVAKEREIFTKQALESGKPENIVEKMVEGRVKKFVNEQSLVMQPFVKNPDTTVGELLKGSNAEVDGFVRFELGEGIEKVEEDFAAEVLAQIK